MTSSTATSWIEILRQAHDIFGARLTAVILTGIREPSPDVAIEPIAQTSADRMALRVALDIAVMLRPLEDRATIQAWFVGKNPMLEDRAPALVLRSNPEAVREAARHFVAYG